MSDERHSTTASDEIPLLGPGQSYESFFRAEYRRTLGLSLVLSGSRSAAEELTQEAFLAAYRRWDEVSRFESPGAWVRRVVANRSVSRFRRSVAETKALVRLGRAPVGDELDLETKLDVWAQVRRLPPRQAQAVALTYLDGMSRREVAEVMACSEETVKTHLERAKKRLAGQLDGIGGRQ